jgi:diguanylate cyclase (GGDEF)-like protein
MLEMPDRVAGGGVGVGDEAARLREELRAERAARLATENAYAALQAAFAALDGGVLLLDSDRVLFANPAIAEAFDISSDRLHRLTREQFVRELRRSSNEPPDFLDRLRERTLKAVETRGEFEIQWPQWRSLRWVSKPVRLPTGNGLLVLFNDITADSDLASGREQRALIDELTGLENRKAGEQSAMREIARARRIGRPLSFVLFDVDHFKRVNDTHGHLAGDMVLREVSRTMTELPRGGDTAVRWGGEEFLVILTDVGFDGARVFAERVRLAIGELRVADVGPVTISAGVSELRLGEDEPGPAIARADASLYLAKSQGRNRVV